MNSIEYNEVIALLESIPSYDYLKIPYEKIYFIKKHSIDNYKVDIENINYDKISPQAYSMFIKLYKEYIASENEKQKIEEILKLNTKIKEEKYKIIFKRNNTENSIVYNELTKVENKNKFHIFLSKVKNFIKNINFLK